VWRSTMREVGTVTGLVVKGGPESYEPREARSTPRERPRYLSGNNPRDAYGG
jgi:hypothetical protein